MGERVKLGEIGVGTNLQTKSECTCDGMSGEKITEKKNPETFVEHPGNRSNLTSHCLKKVRWVSKGLQPKEGGT